MSKTKVCNICTKRKDRTEFYSHHDTKDKLRPYCKTCSKELRNEWAKNNPEKVKAYNTSEKKRMYNREYHNRKSLDPEYRKKNAEYARKRNALNREKNRLYQRERTKTLRDNKERIADYLIQKYGEVPCMDCGHSFPWVAMDFDHRPDEIKEIKIGAYSAQKATSTLITRIEKEIAKCELVCSNCHRIRTEKRRSE